MPARCCPTRASPKASRTRTSCCTPPRTPLILTLYEKRVEKNDLPFFLGLMQHLAARGLSCPLPLPRNDGALLGELSGRPAALITFLEGMWLRKPEAKHCREVGKALAQMHLAGEGFALTRPNALSRRWLAGAVGEVRSARRRGGEGPAGRDPRRARFPRQPTGRRTCRTASSMPTSSRTTSSSSATSCPA